MDMSDLDETTFIFKQCHYETVDKVFLNLLLNHNCGCNANIPYINLNWSKNTCSYCHKKSSFVFLPTATPDHPILDKIPSWHSSPTDARSTSQSPSSFVNNFPPCTFKKFIPKCVLPEGSRFSKMELDKSFLRNAKKGFSKFWPLAFNDDHIYWKSYNLIDRGKKDSFNRKTSKHQEKKEKTDIFKHRHKTRAADNGEKTSYSEYTNKSDSKVNFFDKYKENRCERVMQGGSCHSRCGKRHNLPKDDNIHCKSFYLHKLCDERGCIYLHRWRCSGQIKANYNDKFDRCFRYLKGKNCLTVNCNKVHRHPKEDGIYCFNQKYLTCFQGLACVYLHKTGEKVDISDGNVTNLKGLNSASLNDKITVVDEKDDNCEEIHMEHVLKTSLTEIVTTTVPNTNNSSNMNVGTSNDFEGNYYISCDSEEEQPTYSGIGSVLSALQRKGAENNKEKKLQTITNTKNLDNVVNSKTNLVKCVKKISKILSNKIITNSINFQHDTDKRNIEKVSERNANLREHFRSEKRNLSNECTEKSLVTLNISRKEEISEKIKKESLIEIQYINSSENHLNCMDSSVSNSYAYEVAEELQEMQSPNKRTKTGRVYSTNLSINKEISQSSLSIANVLSTSIKQESMKESDSTLQLDVSKHSTKHLNDIVEIFSPCEHQGIQDKSANKIQLGIDGEDDKTSIRVRTNNCVAINNLWTTSDKMSCKSIEMIDLDSDNEENGSLVIDTDNDNDSNNYCDTHDSNSVDSDDTTIFDYHELSNNNSAILEKTTNSTSGSISISNFQNSNKTSILKNDINTNTTLLNKNSVVVKNTLNVKEMTNRNLQSPGSEVILSNDNSFESSMKKSVKLILGVNNSENLKPNQNLQIDSTSKKSVNNDKYIFIQPNLSMSSKQSILIEKKSKISKSEISESINKIGTLKTGKCKSKKPSSISLNQNMNSKEIKKKKLSSNEENVTLNQVAKKMKKCFVKLEDIGSENEKYEPSKVKSCMRTNNNLLRDSISKTNSNTNNEGVAKSLKNKFMVTNKRKSKPTKITSKSMIKSSNLDNERKDEFLGNSLTFQDINKKIISEKMTLDAGKNGYGKFETLPKKQNEYLPTKNSLDESRNNSSSKFKKTTNCILLEGNNDNSKRIRFAVGNSTDEKILTSMEKENLCTILNKEKEANSQFDIKNNANIDHTPNGSNLTPMKINKRKLSFQDCIDSSPISPIKKKSKLDNSSKFHVNKSSPTTSKSTVSTKKLNNQVVLKRERCNQELKAKKSQKVISCNDDSSLNTSPQNQSKTSISSLILDTSSDKQSYLDEKKIKSDKKLTEIVDLSFESESDKCSFNFSEKSCKKFISSFENLKTKDKIVNSSHKFISNSISSSPTSTNKNYVNEIVLLKSKKQRKFNRATLIIKEKDIEVSKLKNSSPQINSLSLDSPDNSSFNVGVPSQDSNQGQLHYDTHNLTDKKSSEWNIKHLIKRKPRRIRVEKVNFVESEMPKTMELNEETNSVISEKHFKKSKSLIRETDKSQKMIAPKTFQDSSELSINHCPKNFKKIPNTASFKASSKMPKTLEMQEVNRLENDEYDEKVKLKPEEEYILNAAKETLEGFTKKSFRTNELFNALISLCDEHNLENISREYTIASLDKNIRLFWTYSFTKKYNLDNSCINQVVEFDMNLKDFAEILRSMDEKYFT